MAARPHMTKKYKEAAERFRTSGIIEAHEQWRELVTRPVHNAIRQSLAAAPADLKQAHAAIERREGHLWSIAQEVSEALYEVAVVYELRDKDDYPWRVEASEKRWRWPFDELVHHKTGETNAAHDSFADTRAEVFVLRRLERLHPRSLSWHEMQQGLPEHVAHTRFRRAMENVIEAGFIEQTIVEDEGIYRQGVYSLASSREATALRQRHSALRRIQILADKPNDWWRHLAYYAEDDNPERALDVGGRLVFAVEEIAAELEIAIMLDEAAREIIQPEEAEGGDVIELRR